MVKKVIHAEYGAAFILLLFIYVNLEFSLWWFFLLLFVPDVMMAGYLVNTKVGAALYNLGHNLVLPIICVGVSFYFSSETGLMLALIWLAHILMDRFLGYGLKYSQSFKETHMQKI